MGGEIGQKNHSLEIFVHSKFLYVNVINNLVETISLTTYLVNIGTFYMHKLFWMLQCKRVDDLLF